LAQGITSRGRGRLPSAAPGPMAPAVLAGVLVAALAAPHGPWKVEDFPDPVTQPFLCGRNVSGWICDPDHILGARILDDADEQLRVISTQTSVLCGAGKLPFQMGVAVLGAMDRSSGNVDAVPSGPEAARALGSWSPRALAAEADLFTERLGNAWAIGQERCNNGIMLLVSVQDAVAVLKTGPGARDSLADDTVIAILQDLRAQLRGGDWGPAVADGVRDVALALRGEYRRTPDLPVWVRVAVVLLGAVGLLLAPAVLACLAYPFVYCCMPAGEPGAKQPFFAPRRLLRLYLGTEDEATPDLPRAAPLL